MGASVSISMGCFKKIDLVSWMIALTSPMSRSTYVPILLFRTARSLSTTFLAIPLMLCSFVERFWRWVARERRRNRKTKQKTCQEFDHNNKKSTLNREYNLLEMCEYLPYPPRHLSKKPFSYNTCSKKIGVSQKSCVWSSQKPNFFWIRLYR